MEIRKASNGFILTLVKKHGGYVPPYVFETKQKLLDFISDHYEEKNETK